MKEGMTTLPIETMKLIHTSNKKELQDAAAWIECADEAAQLSSVSMKLLELQRLKETNYFDIMKKLVQ